MSAPDEPFDETPCKCGGAWHAVGDHCVNWTCPGCDRTEPDCPLAFVDDAGEADPGLLLLLLGAVLTVLSGAGALATAVAIARALATATGALG